MFSIYTKIAVKARTTANGKYGKYPNSLVTIGHFELLPPFAWC